MSDAARGSTDRERAVVALPDDVSLALTKGANLLLLGDRSAVDRTLDAMRWMLAGPVSTWRSGDPLQLPAPMEPGTLLLREVDRLPQGDQSRLEAWASTARGAMQIISTSTHSVYPMVLTGAFSDRLYYQLNTVLVELAEDAEPAAVASGSKE